MVTIDNENRQAWCRCWMKREKFPTNSPRGTFGYFCVTSITLLNSVFHYKDLNSDAGKFVPAPHRLPPSQVAKKNTGREKIWRGRKYISLSYVSVCSIIAPPKGGDDLMRRLLG